jgi:hypothetical protein
MRWFESSRTEAGRNCRDEISGRSGGTPLGCLNCGESLATHRREPTIRLPDIEISESGVW